VKQFSFSIAAMFIKVAPTFDTELYFFVSTDTNKFLFSAVKNEDLIAACTFKLVSENGSPMKSCNASWSSVKSNC
jgi:hypothetical protein